MNINDAIRQRHSCRAFTDQIVTEDQVQQLLDIASHAPSGANTQPWQVAIVTGQTKLTLQQKIQQAFESGQQANPDYPYYPTEWQQPYLSRRKDCGLQLYQSLNINKQDKARRLTQWAANYRAFDAPVMLLFFMDDIMQTGSYLDYGMFLQSLMLTAMDSGLATCPQAALAEYPDIVRETLGYDNNKQLLCGIALGYEDTQAAVNQYRTPREASEQFSDFFD